MKRRGILSNTYVPQLSPQTTAKVLSKLNTSSLYDICLFWCKWSPLTYPKTTTTTPDEVYEEILELKKSNANKRKLIDRILSVYWPKGLNLLQMSQLDVQNIIDKPTYFNWISSTAKTSDDKNFIVNLNSQAFLQTVIQNISNLYLSHIYISKHPHFPLILIRIQVFDYSIVPLVLTATNQRRSRQQQQQKFIISKRPFFLAIPLNSPHIIHSEFSDQDLVSNIVLQAIESCLSTSFKQVRLFRDLNESSVRTLETMHIFKGVSRFGGSLGTWAPYADGTVDISPLGDPNNHIEVNPDKFYDNSSQLNEEEDDTERAKEIRRKIANLRFKGTELPLESQRLYEDDRPHKKRKQNSSDNNMEQQNEEQEQEQEQQENPYKSIAPIQKLQSRMITNLRNGEEVNVALQFEGNDVFAGLHELCVSGIIDPVKMPGWLTGEEGNRYIEVSRTGESDLI